jgi:N-methylhydantoinase A
LPADQFLGGEFKLDLNRTRELVRKWLKGSGSQLSLESFAAGVIRVVNANMEKAIRVVSVERGHDPRRFALVAFGGAGAMHACELARALRIPQVLVPAYPGALSALGILISDVVKDQSRTVLLRGVELPQGQMDKVYSELQREIAAELRREEWGGKVQYERSADMRYQGQGYEISLPYDRDLIQRFHAEHKRRYGYSSPNREIEIVTLRMRGRLPSAEKIGRMKVQQEAGKLKAGSAQVWFDGRKSATRILPRTELRAGKKYTGPAIVTEYSATTVVPPRMRFAADRAGNLVIEVQ